MPQTYELNNVYDLLNSRYFSNDKDIDMKRKTLKEAIDKYCLRLKDQGLAITCSEDHKPQLPEPKILTMYNCPATSYDFWVSNGCIDQLSTVDNCQDTRLQSAKIFQQYLLTLTSTYTSAIYSCPKVDVDLFRTAVYACPVVTEGHPQRNFACERFDVSKRTIYKCPFNPYIDASHDVVTIAIEFIKNEKEGKLSKTSVGEHGQQESSLLLELKLSIMVNKIKNNHATQSKPQRLSDKEMRELLTKLKKEADKTPEEKDSLIKKYGDIYPLRSAIIKFGGFQLSYDWYGRTRLGKEVIGNLTIYTKEIHLNSLFAHRLAGLQSDIPNFSKLFGFSKLINSIAHELAHCLMANYKLQFGYKHDKAHSSLTQDVEAFMLSLPEVKELGRLQKSY
ncbi:20463_t:CDS:2 [Funneliformis geosporum]|nr:20463_t:CDS:2 [Funneliformis geosporum]